MADDHRSRAGSVLLLVAGLASLLLALAVAFLIQVRSDVGGMAVVAKDAQCRLMLSAALSYIQETSRIGWGIQDPYAEACGWTDLRDGAPGPLGTTQDDGTRRQLGWETGGDYPAPGAAMRGDAYCRVRPPYALRATMAPTPFQLHSADAAPDEVRRFIGAPFTDWGDKVIPVWTRMRDQAFSTGLGAKDAQPAADTWNDFERGIPQARMESVGLAWFRIYREERSEHDGDGSPWYDTMPLGGHAVFIVTVGAGATRGYRFWSDGQDCLGGDATRSAPYSRALDPVTAQRSGVFPDLESFREARANERIAWYRVQWTASSGGGLDHNLAQGSDGMFRTNGNYSLRNQVLDQGGTFRFIQRLEQEPPRW